MRHPVSRLIPGCSVRVDCAGTLRDAQPEAAAKATSVKHFHAHLWSRWHSSGLHSELHKTLAHATSADVEKGLTTEWERKGNNHADRLAKAGAKVHPLDIKHFREWKAFRQLAKEAAKWAGTHEVLLRRYGWRDHEDLGTLAKSKSTKLVLVGNPVSSAAAVLENPDVVDSRPMRGHHCLKATLDDGSSVFCCSGCGSYAWKSTKGFRAVCPGAAGRGKGAAAQLQRFNDGRFPAQGMASFRIGQPSSITRKDWQWLHMGKHIEVGQDLVGFFRPVAARLDRADCLAAYGLTEDTLDFWYQRSKSLKQVELGDDCDFELLPGSGLAEESDVSEGEEFGVE